MFDTTTLKVIATALERSAASAVKLAEEASHIGEKDEALKQTRRAARNSKWAINIRDAIAELEGGKKTEARRPEMARRPTWEEVKAFAFSLGWPEKDALCWFDHFESNGWMISGRSPVRDWQAAARNGHRRWHREHGTKQTTKKPDAGGDPEGYKDWLKATNQQYRPHARLQDYAKRAFGKWVSGRKAEK